MPDDFSYPGIDDPCKLTLWATPRKASVAVFDGGKRGVMKGILRRQLEVLESCYAAYADAKEEDDEEEDAAR